MHTHRFVGWQCPRGRRPDHGKCRAIQVIKTKGFGHICGVVRMHFEGDINGRRMLVFVFDFGFGQGRATVQTPVHWLETLIQITITEHFAERANLVRFGAEVHGQVGIIPIAQHTQTDEILFLARHLFGGIGTTQLAHFVGRQITAVLLFNLVFDGQTMAVPARHILRIKACQHLRTNDDVLENLVDRMTDMDVAIGIGRTIVQHKARAPFRVLLDLLIQPTLLPVGNPARFALG